MRTTPSFFNTLACAFPSALELAEFLPEAPPADFPNPPAFSGAADFDDVGFQWARVGDECFFEFAAGDDEFFLFLVEEVGDVAAGHGEGG